LAVPVSSVTKQSLIDLHHASPARSKYRSSRAAVSHRLRDLLAKNGSRLTGFLKPTQLVEQSDDFLRLLDAHRIILEQKGNNIKRACSGYETSDVPCRIGRRL
jgi:hypothetical protein